jgi:hypothetical protein
MRSWSTERKLTIAVKVSSLRSVAITEALLVSRFAACSACTAADTLVRFCIAGGSRQLESLSRDGRLGGEEIGEIVGFVFGVMDGLGVGRRQQRSFVPVWNLVEQRSPQPSQLSSSWRSPE